ncbi:MAG: hypothetical protein AAGK17_08365 [Pseudomonadota bacterium]
MNRLSSATVLASIFAIAACGSPADQSIANNEADDFAQRINAGKPPPAPQGTVAPTVAEPLEGAAEGVYAPGTATDPQSAICGANEMGPYIGQEATDDVQLAILNVIDGANDVRFVAAGSEFIRPDPTNPRLNIMLDNGNIIRDARCG